MRSHHHAEIVSLHEGIQVVSSESDNVILFLRVSDIVVLEPCHIFAFIRITPEKVDNFLMVVDVVGPEFNCEGS